MVEISKSGSGEGFGWATGRGYSTIAQIVGASAVAKVGAVPTCCNGLTCTVPPGSESRANVK